MKNIFITGATGFLGGELLVDLSKRNEVNKIYCLVRAGSKEKAIQRLKKVFDFHGDVFDPERIIPVQGDLAQDDLTECLIENKMLADVNYVVHSAANTSFSPIYDKLVEEININGLEKVLKWSQSLKELDSFVYVGTATICGKQVKNRTVTEDESPNPNAEHLVKYTYTKTQGEILLHKYLTEDKVLIVRPSIILGDSRPWIPRSYVIMWTLATVNFLRLIPGDAHCLLDMVPVDYVSSAITKLMFKKRKYNVYHISAGEAAATTSELLCNTIAQAFPDQPKFNFIGREMLKDVKLWARKRLNDDSKLNDYPEYLDYWNSIMDDTSDLRILMGGLDPYIEFMELGQVFDNSRLLEENIEGVGQSKPAHEYIKNSIHLLENIDIFEAALEP